MQGGAVEIDRTNFMDREIRFQGNKFLKVCTKAIEDLKCHATGNEFLAGLAAMSAVAYNQTQNSTNTIF